MFVEALAEGRGVSLPAAGLGAAKAISAGVGAYARVRKQFRVPLAEFGGIQAHDRDRAEIAPRSRRRGSHPPASISPPQEALARATRESYIIISGVELMNAIVDNHEVPIYASAFVHLHFDPDACIPMCCTYPLRRRWSSRRS